MSTYDAHAHYASDRETTHAGASCELCGDDADFIRDMKGGFSMPVCTNCDHDKITSCPDCGDYILMHAGVRVFNTPDLYCLSCAYSYPHMGPDRRDEMNEASR